jgi:hypothetical protein
MGMSLSWVAVESLADEEALSRLSLCRTDRIRSYPFKGVSSHALRDAWLLIVAGRCDHRIARAPAMSVLSAGCRAVACAVEEHVNFASAELWQDGRRLWHVKHQGDVDPENLTAQGALPRRFHELLSTVEPEDSESLAGHFHMDIPLILARELTGFRHDEADPVFDAAPFDELTDLAPGRSWWQLWR